MNDFYKKTGVVVAAVLVVLVAAKILVIDEVKKLHSADAKIDTAGGAPRGNGGVDFVKKDKAVIKWQEAGKYLGRYVETEGEIISAYNNGRICFLNFSKDYRNTMTLVIFADDFPRFPDRPEKYYMGKKVRVEGRVKDYKGKVEIALKSADQVKVVPK